MSFGLPGASTVMLARSTSTTADSRSRRSSLSAREVADIPPGATGEWMTPSPAAVSGPCPTTLWLIQLKTHLDRLLRRAEGGGRRNQLPGLPNPDGVTVSLAVCFAD